MIIDAHTHAGEFHKKQFPAETLIASMDEAGIDYSMVISLDRAEEGSSIDEIINFCDKYPRLKPIGNFDLDDFGTEQIDKVKKYLKDGKIHAIKFYPGYQNYYPVDERILSLYEFCQSIGKPIIFHTGVLASGSKGILKQIHPLNIDEVANKFSDLKIVMAHFGNPWVMDAAAVVSKNPNVYVDFSGYFGEWVSISDEDLEMFLRVLKDFKIFTGGFKKCLFGTDWPLYNQKEYLEAVQKLPMTEEEKELVFWKNANEIYQLKI